MTAKNKFVGLYQKDTGYINDTIMNRKEIEHNEEACREARMAIQETWDVVGGKWKLILIAILKDGKLIF